MDINLKKIDELEKKGVVCGDARNNTKHDINRNITLDSELQSCEVLLKSFDPQKHKIKLLTQSGNNSEHDINIDEDKYIFEVKHMVLPKFELEILDVCNFYFDLVMNDNKFKNKFIQLVVTLDDSTMLHTIEERNIKIHRADNITGVEILIELNMFNYSISKKIKRIYSAAIKKGNIPIVDVRNVGILDYEYIKQKIHEHHSEKGYFVLFLTYVLSDNGKQIPTFCPICHPREKYSELLKALSSSISLNPKTDKHVYSCCYKRIDSCEQSENRFIKDEIDGRNWNELIGKDEEGYLIIEGNRICKSLVDNEIVEIYGVMSNRKNSVEIKFDINGEEMETNLEWLKYPNNK